MSLISAIEEKGLLEKIKLGDTLAFEQLYNRYERRIFYNLLKLVRIKEVAAELHQDVFLRLWLNRGQLDPGRPLMAYLRQIAKNLAIDFYRKASRDQLLQEQLIQTMTELHDPVNDYIENKEIHDALERAISKLPAQRQQVFRLIKMENKSYEYAANHFGVSLSTIKDHMAKASRTLKEDLFTAESGVMMIALISAFSNNLFR